ncbi:MAG: hypothetical protein V3T83_04950 [Acidobacteriota bacterium]
MAFVEAHRDEVEHPAELLVVAAIARQQLSSGRNGDPSQKEQALALFQEIREIDPSNVSAHYYPGTDLAFRPETRTQGFALLKQAIELSPGSVPPRGFFWMRARSVRGKERQYWLDQAAWRIEDLIERSKPDAEGN